MELTVRQAQPADLEEIQAMYRALVARMDRDGWKIWSDRYPRDAVGEDIALGRFYLLADLDLPPESPRKDIPGIPVMEEPPLPAGDTARERESTLAPAPAGPSGGVIAGGFALLPTGCGEGDPPWEEPDAPAQYLYRFGVAVEYGGRGVGKLALERIQELSRSLGAGYLRLFVAYENAPAIGLYEKAGFRRVPGEFGEVLQDGTRLYEYAYEKKL
ncbi:MAG: GNAT family N-acetyltransferase [Acutalibacter sp.]